MFNVNVNVIVSLIVIFYSTQILSSIHRTPNPYKSTGARESDRLLCIERYKEEILYTKDLLPQMAYCHREDVASDIDAIYDKVIAEKPNLEEIAVSYKALLNKLSLCRMETMLDNPLSYQELVRETGGDSTDLKRIFLHVLGDIFGKDTGLEGGDSGQMLKYRLRLLKVLEKKTAMSTFINDNDQAKPCAKLRDVVNRKIYDNYPEPDLDISLVTKLVSKTEGALSLNVQSLQPSLVQFQHYLIEQIEGLAQGDSLFFPIGWSRHAISIEIEREDNQHVTFRMYNTGEGIDKYHSMTTYGHERRFVTYVDRIHVPIPTLTGLATLAALKQISFASSCKHRTKRFLRALLTNLGRNSRPIS